MDEEDGRCESVLESRMLSVDIHILLVDDDATSLAVVSAMLRLCKYQGFSFFFFSHLYFNWFSYLLFINRLKNAHFFPKV